MNTLSCWHMQTPANRHCSLRCLSRHWPGRLRLFITPGPKDKIVCRPCACGATLLTPACSPSQRLRACVKHLQPNPGRAQVGQPGQPMTTRQFACLLATSSHGPPDPTKCKFAPPIASPGCALSHAGITMLSAEGASTCIRVPCSMAPAAQPCHPSCAYHRPIPAAACPWPLLQCNRSTDAWCAATNVHSTLGSSQDSWLLLSPSMTHAMQHRMDAPRLPCFPGLPACHQPSRAGSCLRGCSACIPPLQPLPPVCLPAAGGASPLTARRCP